MYRYTDFDRQFVHQRAAQFRDQLERWQAGKLSEDEFKPLRLQNGWYVQRYAPMLRVAVTYGELAARQLQPLALVHQAAPQLLGNGAAVATPHPPGHQPFDEAGIHLLLAALGAQQLSHAVTVLADLLLQQPSLAGE